MKSPNGSLVAHALLRAASTLVSTLGLAVTLHATTFYVTVAGLGGEPDYEQRFASLAQEMEKLLKAPDATIVTLYGREATPEDALVVMLIGHGSFDGVDYKLQLPGADMTAIELASALDHIPATRQLVLNTTSASGASRGVLMKPNRIVVTATKSGSEKNATVFARYF